MATIGYARVSTREQNPDGQTDALEAAGCDKIFVEHASGALAKRPALTDALGYLREGDSLVVTKLDRLGRSVRTSSRSPTNCSNVGWPFERCPRASIRPHRAGGCSSTCSPRSPSSSTT